LARLYSSLKLNALNLIGLASSKVVDRAKVNIVNAYAFLKLKRFSDCEEYLSKVKADPSYSMYAVQVQEIAGDCLRAQLKLEEAYLQYETALKLCQ